MRSSSRPIKPSTKPIRSSLVRIRSSSVVNVSRRVRSRMLQHAVTFSFRRHRSAIAVGNRSVFVIAVYIRLSCSYKQHQSKSADWESRRRQNDLVQTNTFPIGLLVFYRKFKHRKLQISLQDAKGVTWGRLAMIEAKPRPVLFLSTGSSD